MAFKALKNMWLNTLITAGLLVLFFPPASRPAPREWMQQGGNSAHTGGEGVVPGTPFLTWKTRARDAFFAAPALVGEHILLGDAGGNLNCYRRRSGRRSWGRHGSGYYAGSPVCDGERAYAACTRRDQWEETSSAGGIFSGQGTQSVTMVSEKTTLGCYRLADGMKLWTRRFPGLVHGTPALGEGRLVLACQDFKTYCLDSLHGRQLWEVKAEGPLESSPVIDSGRVLVGSLAGKLYCLSLRDGELLWRYRVDSPIRVAPAASRGGVFFAALDGRLRCLALSTGDLIWEKDLGHILVTSPVIAGTTIVVACSDATVRALHGGTGEELWRTKPARELIRSLAVSGQVLVTGSEEGKLAARSLENGEQIWEYQLGRNDTPLISLAGEEIYASSPDRALYCIGSEKKPLLGRRDPAPVSRLSLEPARGEVPAARRKKE